MKYVSVCSGIEAATNAWHKFGWTPVAFSEIEPFPSAVLKHRFPNIPNYGDLTQYKSWPIEPGSIDLLVGGTPCQSFSVAGLRKGLADPRGNLCLTFLGLADHLRPRWILWENVVGVLSSGGGRDFGAFLGALGQLGYGWAYRILNAENFGVPQRRRRVFVLAYRDPVTGLGDWRVAAEALSVGEGMQRYLEKGKPSRKKPAGDAASGAGTSGGDGTGQPGGHGIGAGCWWDGGQVSQTLDAVLAKGQTMPDKNRFPAVLQPKPVVIDRAAFNQGENAQYVPHIAESEVMDTVVARGPHAVGVPMMFKIRGGSPTETGEQGGTPGKVAGKGFLGSEEKAFTVATTQDQWLAQPIVAPTVTTCKGSRGGSSSEAIDEITAIHLAQQQAQAIPIQDGREIEKKQNGIGVGHPGDPAYTLDTTGGQAVGQPHIVKLSELRLRGTITEMPVCPTLTAGAKQGDSEPLAVHPFRKSKRAQSDKDDETWVDAEVSNTLNNFDLGDTRTTHAVVQQAFMIREDSKNDTFHAKPVETSLCVNALQPSPQSQHAQNFVVSCSSVSPAVSTGAPFSKTGNERVEADALVVEPIPLDSMNLLSRLGPGCENHSLQNFVPGDPMFTLTKAQHHGVAQPVAFQPGNISRKAGAGPSTDAFPTLTKDSGDQSPHVAYCAEVTGTLTVGKNSCAGHQHRMGDSSFLVGEQSPRIAVEMVVRRLSVNECLRLQGFPDNWTNIPWKGKPEGQAPDGPQYKCAGNSMAVPCMSWIGEGIIRVEAKLKAKS